jgi:hypothetical protein
VPREVCAATGDRDRRVDPRQLLDGDRIRDRVAAGASVLLGGSGAHEPELGELGDELVRESARDVELGRDGPDALAGECSDGVADQLLLGVRSRSTAREA